MSANISPELNPFSAIDALQRRTRKEIGGVAAKISGVREPIVGFTKSGLETLGLREPPVHPDLKGIHPNFMKRQPRRLKIPRPHLF